MTSPLDDLKEKARIADKVAEEFGIPVLDLPKFVVQTLLPLINKLLAPFYSAEDLADLHTQNKVDLLENLPGRIAILQMVKDVPLEGMVSCPTCGHKNPAGSKFCNVDGTKLATTLPSWFTRATDEMTLRQVATELAVTPITLKRWCGDYAKLLSAPATDDINERTFTSKDVETLERVKELLVQGISTEEVLEKLDIPPFVPPKSAIPAPAKVVIEMPTAPPLKYPQPPAPPTPKPIAPPKPPAPPPTPKPIAPLRTFVPAPPTATPAPVQKRTALKVQ